MNIALLAHDKKKELMTQFCDAYCGILKNHDLCAPYTTGKLVSNATGMTVKLLLTCADGGYQQIGQRIVHNEVDLVLFFCDPSSQKITKDIDTISRLCDLYTIPMATNVATAEVLIQGLMHGDLDWRNIVNSYKKKQPRLIRKKQKSKVS